MLCTTTQRCINERLVCYSPDLFSDSDGSSYRLVLKWCVSRRKQVICVPQIVQFAAKSVLVSLQNREGHGNLRQYLLFSL